MNKSKFINFIAEKDRYTNDTEYNHGLKLIREHGYDCVCYKSSVQYYCLCNGII